MTDAPSQTARHVTDTVQASRGAPVAARELSAAVALIAILVVALGLRLFLLTSQSLWYDEGVSAFMTTRVPVEIAQAAAADIHPPLYYWLLSVWARVLGAGEASLRGFSVLFGTATVWLVYLLGRRLFSQTVALVAAALLTVSPLAVQYSQEVRMYAQAGFLATAATLVYVWLMERQEPGSLTPLGKARGQRDGSALRRSAVPDLRDTLASNHPPEADFPNATGDCPSVSAVSKGGPGGEAPQRETFSPSRERGQEVGITAPLAYAIVGALLLYTHYYGLLVLVVHQVYFWGTTLLGRRWRQIPAWLAASVLLAVLYLPWLPNALRQTGYYPGLGTPQGPLALAADAVNVLSIGVATTRFELRPGLLPFLLLAAIGLFAPVHQRVGRNARYPRLLLLLWVVLPLATIIILSQTRPLYEPRFLMMILPAWLLLVARGGVALVGWAALQPVRWARAGILGAAFGVALAIPLLIPTMRSLGSYFFDPQYARDNYRGLALTIEQAEQPGDAVVLTAPGQAEVFAYYWDGSAPVFPLPLQRPLDETDTRSRLEAVGGAFQRVWLVRWASVEADPRDLIGTWLDQHAISTSTERFGTVELRLYDLRAMARTRDLPS